MRRDETIYILRPTMSEEHINTVIENTNKIILDDAGTIIFYEPSGA
ncbi:30S ribosomal protein S6 [Desulfotalea psychrophila]|nr:30S ribosomal protein S6 [Desulfotalea psychrophila]